MCEALAGTLVSRDGRPAVEHALAHNSPRRPLVRAVAMDELIHSDSVGVHPSQDRAGTDALFRHVVDVVPIATAVLDRAGLVLSANRAFAELLQLPAVDVVGEPFLMWLSRASEREAFGRAFMALRERDAGSGFVLDLGFLPRLGPRVECVVRSSKLPDGHAVVTCHPSSGNRLAPEAELGLAVTRSLDALDQGVLLVDADGKVVHANPEGIKLLGDGIVGRSVLEMVGSTSVHTVSRALTVARSGSWHGEVVLRRVDGESLPVEISLAAGTGPAVVLLRDLRERRRREFEARLISQVDRCLVQSADPRRNVLAAADALREALGAGRVGLLVASGGGWLRWSLPAPAGGEIVELPTECAPPGAWAESREVDVVSARDPDLERCYGRLDGHASAARIVLRAPSGVVGYLLLAHRDDEPFDVRDRSLLLTVASQIALGLASGLLTLETRELAAYQTMVLDQTSVLLDSVDAHGAVITWNRASEKMLGIRSEDARGRRFGVEVGVAADPRQWEDLWATLLEDGVVAREIGLRHDDGAEIPLHLEGRLLRDEDAVRGAVFVGLDLRERRALEHQILKSQKLAAVGLLAAGIAHEINNPLSGVVGYSRLLLDKPLPDGVREKVEKIAQSGERCRKIVEGVLLFSRQQDGGTRKEIDLRRLVDRVIAIGEYQWRMHNVRVLREGVESLFVHADADQLEQVILNLLSNAVDAMPRGGSVQVSLQQEEDVAVLTVADEGHGIPQEIQDRIFDPFFSTKEIGKGTGLGLAISYGIVQDHGGDIVVESKPEQGSKFTVRLPCSGSSERRNRKNAEK
jgi:PAS domain S-box-containing protein